MRHRPNKIHTENLKEMISWEKKKQYGQSRSGTWRQFLLVTGIAGRTLGSFPGLLNRELILAAEQHGTTSNLTGKETPVGPNSSTGNGELTVLPDRPVVATVRGKHQARPCALARNDPVLPLGDRGNEKYIHQHTSSFTWSSILFALMFQKLKQINKNKNPALEPPFSQNQNFFLQGNHCTLSKWS